MELQGNRNIIVAEWLRAWHPFLMAKGCGRSDVSPEYAIHFQFYLEFLNFPTLFPRGEILNYKHLRLL
jgi:hypothetical protein